MSGLSSNRSFTDLLDYLTAAPADQDLDPSGLQPAGWSDGRRAFGTVSKAIIAVLTGTDTEMPVKAIHAEVERLLNGQVSHHSVSDYLRTRSKGSKPIFERTRYGHYQLLPPS